MNRSEFSNISHWSLLPVGHPLERMCRRDRGAASRIVAHCCEALERRYLLSLLPGGRSFGPADHWFGPEGVEISRSGAKSHAPQAPRPSPPQKSNRPPTIVRQASATITGTEATLTVKAADDGGERNLTYTWSVSATPPGQSSFNPNGNNTAKRTTVAVTAPGTYVYQVTVTDAGGLTASSRVSVAFPPRGVSWQPPLVIDRGGVYTGTWKSVDPNVPAVLVKTTEPVTITGAQISSAGELIATGVEGVDLTVTNTTGLAVNPNIAGRCPGRFITGTFFKSIQVEDNVLLGTAGIYLGYAQPGARIRVIANSAQNIDGRWSDGKNGWQTGEEANDYVQFCQLDNCIGLPSVEISWNQVINLPYQSRVEDNISVFQSSGTAASPILIHHNYIQGAYAADPVRDDSFTGGGIMVSDGWKDPIAADTGYVSCYNNTVVNTTNYGIAISSGHDDTVYSNTVISSGIVPGTSVIAASQNVGIYIWNMGDDFFGGNTEGGNTVGWVANGGNGRNDEWLPDVSPSGLPADTILPDPITQQTEASAYSAWLEDRALTTPVVVNTPVDALFPAASGFVSLRNAIATANSGARATVITFDPLVFSAPQTIRVNGDGFVLNGPLPTVITGPPGRVTIEGNGRGTIFEIGGADTRISNVNITNGAGGIANSAALTLMNLSVAGNSGAGGIVNYGGDVTITDCTIADNASTTGPYGGGGLFCYGGSAELSGVQFSGNSSSWGGGAVYNLDGTVSITDGSISGNRSTMTSEGGAVFNSGVMDIAATEISENSSAGRAGGIWNGAGSVWLTNVTVWGNSAGLDGGGIYNGGFGNETVLTLTNSTVIENTAVNGGGILNVAGGVFTSSNSVIAANTLGGTGGVGPDALGAFDSRGYNLVGATDGSSGWGVLDLQGTVAGRYDPMLTPPGFYGGMSRTAVPMPGSPLLDAGSNALALGPGGVPLTGDQRGYARVVNGTVDIGAVEFQPQPLAATVGSVLSLRRDADGRQIDWTVGSTTGHALASDPEGFCITGDGSNDPVVLDNSGGNALPDYLRVNGTFTVSGLGESDPFAGKTIDVGQSTVYFSYGAGPSAVAFVREALAAGYAGGAWNGNQTSGALVSTRAASGPAGLYGMGYADSADGVVNGPPANTVEVRFTVMGDANLDRVVDSVDAIQLARNFLDPGHSDWDQGDFNYDGTIDMSDATILRGNYNATASVATLSSSIDGMNRLD